MSEKSTNSEIEKLQAERLRSAATQLDQNIWAFYLRVPRSQVVLLQAYFELYDGVGTVRTLTDPEPTLCVMTSRDLLEDCIGALVAIRKDVDWEVSALR
jgi:hypothetical protein